MMSVDEDCSGDCNDTDPICEDNDDTDGDDNLICG